MQVVFLDLEMNQADNLEERIIEIGAVNVNLRTGEQKSFFNELCNPEEKLVPFITKLTGIAQFQVDAAHNRSDVFARFWAWHQECGVRGVVYSWGDDGGLLARQSVLLGVEVPKVNLVDFSQFFRWLRGASQRPLGGGLKDSLKEVGMTFQGTQHRALTDAENTARLGVHLFGVLRKYYKLAKAFREPA